MEQFVYHWVPPGMKGLVLHPLNELKKMPGFEGICARAEAKYHTSPSGEPRLWVMEQDVAPLRCKWNDVLQFSPVHPKDIADAIKAEGCVWVERGWFAIPADLLEREKTCIFARASRGPAIPADFVAFDPAVLPRYAEITQAARDYYRSIAEMPNSSKRPLLWAPLPHVFYKGSIDTACLERIRV